MKEELSVSVVMAVYNGGLYLEEQIRSIIPQLKVEDELIISYDKSIDNTLEIIEYFAKENNCIKITHNKNQGVVSNFENGLKIALNEIIFLADQDDIWRPNKIDLVRDSFKAQDVLVVIHDCSLIDHMGIEIHPSTFKMRWGNVSVLRNLIRLSYIGCSMAFRRKYLSVILPIPTKKRSHDWWIGTLLSLYGRMELINEVLVEHRVHNNNATPKLRPSLYYQLEVRSLIILNAISRKFNTWKI